MKTSWAILSIACTTGAVALAAGADFDPRQKWESNEVNCIQISNPTPGAAYRPGYFVRMFYGTQFCNGASAAAPWTIHLYNHLQIKDGRVVYDYHEVLANNINEYNTQYLWSIPANYLDKTNIREQSQYYVRVETTSQDGQRLVGNAGPFSIIRERGLKKRRADALGATN